MMKKILSLLLCLVLWAGIADVCGEVTASAESGPVLKPLAITVIPSNYGAPRITKNPTDEWVNEYGRCQFVSRYENAILAEWHFVSPDGRQDLTYVQAERTFPPLRVIMGNTKDMTLDNIPYSLNGWRVYCRFSNNYGSADTGMALITVAPGSGGGYVRPTGNSMIVFYRNGSTERVSAYSDGSWRTSAGTVYFMGSDGVLRSGMNPELYTYNPSGGSSVTPRPTGTALTVYNVYGGSEQVYSYSDGTWRSAGGVTYFMGNDGVLRASGYPELYTYNPNFAPTPAPAQDQQYAGEWRFAWTAGGARVTLNNRGDGIWRSETGILYYQGSDGVLRANGAENLYFR